MEDNLLWLHENKGCQGSCPYCRIAELEARELGFIQSLRELEEEKRNKAKLTPEQIAKMKERWHLLSMVCFSGCREGRLCSACREQVAISERLKGGER